MWNRDLAPDSLRRMNSALLLVKYETGNEPQPASNNWCEMQERLAKIEQQLVEARKTNC